MLMLSNPAWHKITRVAEKPLEKGVKAFHFSTVFRNPAPTLRPPSYCPYGAEVSLAKEVDGRLQNEHYSKSSQGRFEAHQAWFREIVFCSQRFLPPPFGAPGFLRLFGSIQ